MNLFRRGRVAHSHHVIAEQANANCSAIVGNFVDGAARVIFCSYGKALQISSKLPPVEMPLKNLGKSHWAVRAVGIGHAIERESCPVEIPLWINARCIDEVLVIGIVLHGMFIEVGRGAQGAKVEVNNTVRLRKKTRDLGRRYL